MRALRFSILFFLVLQACQSKTPDYIKGRWKGEKPLGTVISLNGTWKVAEGSLEQMPSDFNHTVTVPGLIKSAVPAFEETGVASSKREAYWYKTSFTIPENAPYDVARLIIKKSRYGTVVFVNGKEAGRNMLNFTSSDIDITPLIKKGDKNELIVRIGAHISNGPDTVSTAGEVEKHKYYAGIYDDVDVVLSKAPYISNVQIAPDLKKNEALVETELVNPFNKVEKFSLSPSIYDDQTKEKAAGAQDVTVILKPLETKKIQFTVSIPNAKLWTPESPELYVLEIRKDAESSFTRFGMRTFRVDSSYTNKALLNEKQYFLRGTNVALFRFFEDTLCRQQPWDYKWVTTLHERFKKLNWNSYRISISALPNFWYDIADEQGFVIFDEYPMWYALQNQMAGEKAREKNLGDPVRKYGVYPPKLTADRLVNEYTHWMREHWNHASVCAWDAQNETWTPATGKAINRVRHLDLSDRPWDNGWSPPAGKNDYREAHNYFASYNVGSEDKNPRAKVRAPFRLSDLPDKDKIGYTFYEPYQAYYEHGKFDEYWDFPCVLNEYGYLWLNRDGSPTTLTKPYYDAVLGPEATADQRFHHYATMLAALTEYWRENRTFFGVLQVFGLDFSAGYAATGDIFTNIDSLTFYPHFEKYVADAFAPAGICIDYWKTEMKTYHSGWPPIKGFEVPVVITNDQDEKIAGTFILKLVNLQTGRIYHQKTYAFEVCALQQTRRIVKLLVPRDAGKYILSAELQIRNEKPATSYREISFTDQNTE